MRPTSRPRPAAAQRTVSMFTGKTDVEAPNARDGSDPDPEDRETLSMRPKHRWKRLGDLRTYYCDTALAQIRVENERPKSKDGAWKYIVTKFGKDIGTFDNIAAAADVAERDDRAPGPMGMPVRGNAERPER